MTLPTTNTTITVNRPVETSGEHSQGAHLTSVPAFIMTDDEVVGADDRGAVILKTHTMMTNVVDIKIHDKITDADSNIYYVRGALTHSTLAGSHMQFVLTKKYGS